MIAILEAGIDGVNMRSRGQGAIQQVVALIGTKILRIGSRHLGDKAQKAFGTFDQIMGALDAGLAGLRDRVMQDRDHSGRIPVVIVDQDENKNGNAEADEKQRHDQAQPRLSDPGEPRRCCLLDQGTVQEAATAIGEKGQHRNRPNNQQGRQKQQRSFEPVHAVMIVPDQTLWEGLVGDKTEIVVGPGDASPALGVLLSDPVGIAPNQRLGVLRLKQQCVAALFLRVVLKDEIDGRVLVRNRISPAF